MTGKRVGSAMTLLLLYVGLTFVFTFPLVSFFGTHHVGEDAGDARTYIWNMWWVDKALTELHTNPFETDFIFYPLGIGLSLHTLGFSQGLEFILLKSLLGDVAAANAILMVSFVASALGMYALARYLGAPALGAFLAGMAFAFCPYRLARLAGHYDLLGTEWIPLYTLVFLKAVRDDRRGLSLVGGAAVLAAACGYTTLTYLAFLTLLTALFLLWETARLAPSPRPLGALLGRSAAIGLVAATLLLPLLLQLGEDLSSWSYTAYPGSDRYGADLAAYAMPGPKQNLLGASWGGSFDRNLTEAVAFPGYLLLFMVGAALASRPMRRLYGFWMVAAGFFFILSLGSTLKIAGWEPGIPLPFALFQKLPLLEHLRAPSRFSLLVVFCGAVLLAVTWGRWMERVSQPLWRGLLTAGAAGILVAEYLAIPIPLFPASVAPVYHQIAEEKEDYTVVEIPGVEQVPGRLMYHQTVHGKRILIGTAARVPREKMDYYFGLPLIRPLVDLRRGRIPLSEELIQQQRELAPAVAAFLSIRYFVVDRAFAKRGVLDFLERVLPVERAYQDRETVALRVRPEALPPDPWKIDPGSEDSRMHFESGWSRPEEAEGRRFRWANGERSTLLLRRPADDVRELVVEIAPLDRTQQMVGARLDDTWLGEASLSSGWNELRWTLPPRGTRRVERLWLRWSDVRQASERDARRLAARVAGIRFE